jgi:hypothetical protein
MSQRNNVCVGSSSGTHFTAQGYGIVELMMNTKSRSEDPFSDVLRRVVVTSVNGQVRKAFVFEIFLLIHSQAGKALTFFDQTVDEKL